MKAPLSCKLLLSGQSADMPFLERFAPRRPACPFLVGLYAGCIPGVPRMRGRAECLQHAARPNANHGGWPWLARRVLSYSHAPIVNNLRGEPMVMSGLYFRLSSVITNDYK